MSEKLLTAIRTSFTSSVSARPDGTLAANQQVSRTASASLAKTLSVGDTIVATVEETWPEQKLARLRIGNYELLASTRGMKLPGGQVALQVTAVGSKPEFRLLAPSSGMNQVRNEALKNFLPRQQLATELAGLLEVFSRHSASPTPALSQTAGLLLQSIPGFRQLAQPAELFRLVANSGVFFESRLLSGQPTAATESGDFKARLLQMSLLLQQYLDNGAALKRPQAGRLSGTDPGLLQLLESTEGMLSSVVVDQLRSLPRQDGSQAWVITLPYQENDRTERLSLEITDESSSNSEAGQQPSARSSVRVDFTLSQLGRIQVHARLSASDLSLQIRCQQHETMHQFQKYRDMLVKQLLQSGITPADIIISDGIVSEDAPPSAGPLIREKV